VSVVCELTLIGRTKRNSYESRVLSWGEEEEEEERQVMDEREQSYIPESDEAER